MSEHTRAAITCVAAIAASLICLFHGHLTAAICFAFMAWWISE